MFVMTNICHHNTFVATKIFCRDKHTFVATNVFVVTKIILAAAPTNDREIPQLLGSKKGNEEIL